MLRNNKLNEGFNKVCDIEKDHMLMDVDILKAHKNNLYVIEEAKKEVAILLVEGNVKICIDDVVYECKRNSCFHDNAKCVHLPAGKKVTICAIEDSECLIQKAYNDLEFETKFYDDKCILRQQFGEGKLFDTSKRIVTTIFDYENAPYSKMVLGEIINHPGIWSSYPPHSHPHPEVYYYRFNKPQGFGTCFVGEDAYKINDHSVSLIPGDLVHPQNSAPGYAMYYVWMIPHLPNNPWIKTRDMDEKHSWLFNDEEGVIKL